MKLFIVSFIVFLTSSAFAQKDSIQLVREEHFPPKDFTEALQRSHMTFLPPKGYTKTKIFPNRQQDYVYALISPDKKVEVRYAIMPLDSMIAKYKRPREKDEIMIDPNNLHETMFTVITLNTSMGALSGGNPQEPSIFDSAAVMNEFGADWGATVGIPAGKEFGQDYKYCLIVALHKDDRADAWLFYLANDNKEIEQHLMDAFHSIRFN